MVNTHQLTDAYKHEGSLSRHTTCQGVCFYVYSHGPSKPGIGRSYISVYYTSSLPAPAPHYTTTSYRTQKQIRQQHAPTRMHTWGKLHVPSAATPSDSSKNNILYKRS